MPNTQSILKINMDNTQFSHGIMRGEFDLDIGKMTLLMGDNGVGKTSFVEYLKKEQHRVFNNSVFFVSQDELIKHEVLNAQDLKKILSESVSDKFDHGLFNKFVSELSLESHVLDKCIAKLSGGERQLIKLALSFAIKADYYVIDEPFNNLSVDKRKKLRAYIKQQLKGALIIDHFHDEWIDDFDNKVLINYEANDLFIKEVLE